MAHRKDRHCGQAESYHTAVHVVSIEVSTYVWKFSRQKSTALLLMLAIADHAHDDGDGAYPSIATLARKARTTERNVKLLLKKLQEQGELEIRRNAGPKRTNVYRVKNFHPILKGSNDGSNNGSGETGFTPNGHRISPLDYELSPSARRRLAQMREIGADV